MFFKVVIVLVACHKVTALFEGDIKVPYELVAEEYSGVLADNLLKGGYLEDSYLTFGTDPKRIRRWDDGVVPFTFSPSSTFTNEEKELITSELSYMSLITNDLLVFKMKDDNDPNYISFDNSGVNGCWSYMGMVGGAQTIHLGEGCVNSGTVTHETMHALGFWHEHSRPDRDEYIQIFTENIKPTLLSQFEVRKSIDSMGTAYDLKSIMHYGNRVFSVNGKVTLSSLEFPDMKLGGGVLTDMDIEQLKLLYGGVNLPSAAPTFLDKCGEVNRHKRCKGVGGCRWSKRTKKCIKKKN
jgi:hypothetical protein